MYVRTRSFCLSFLTLLWTGACSGHVEKSNSGSQGPQDRETAPHEADGLPSEDGDREDDHAAGGGTADDEGIEIIPIELAGTGGIPLTPIDVDHWCPTGEQLDTIFEGEPSNLGGAASDAECPELPSTSYSESYCVATFTSTLPVARNEPGGCCYEIATIYCR